MIILSTKSDLRQLMMFQKDFNLRRVIWVIETLRSETALLVLFFSGFRRRGERNSISTLEFSLSFISIQEMLPRQHVVRWHQKREARFLG